VSTALSHRVQMRWRDIDGLGHVNNAVAFTYMEEGRDEFFRQHGIPRDEYVVGRCKAEFKHEIDPGCGTVVVECELRDLGRSSLITAQRILDEEGGVVVDAEFGIVLWDPHRRASRPISDEERAALEASLKGEVRS
jgi:acyl-CoA thioester hydrolase